MSADAIRDVRQTTLDYLANHAVLTLATQGSRGLWAAAVFYANEDFNIYFISAGHTRHAQNISETQQAAGTIQEDYHDWAAIKGIQLEGSVHLLTGGERERAITIYGDKYPLINTASGPILSALELMNWYWLMPTTVYLVNNSKGFGHRDEVNIVGL